MPLRRAPAPRRRLAARGAPLPTPRRRRPPRRRATAEAATGAAGSSCSSCWRWSSARALRGQQDVPALPRRGRGHRRGHDPRGLRRRARSARSSPPRASSTPRASSSSTPPINGDRGKLRPGKYTLKQGMTNGDAIAALQVVPEGPKAVETVDVRLLEGPSRKENAPVVDDSKKVEGELRQGDRRRRPRCAGSASSARRGARRPPRASCSRPPTRSRSARPPTGSSRSSSTRSRRTSPRST